MPVIPAPRIEPSQARLTFWTDYRLTLQVAGRAPGTITSCRSSVLTMAKHATAEELEPADVTRVWMLDYLLRQQAARWRSRTVSQATRPCNSPVEPSIRSRRMSRWPQ